MLGNKLPAKQTQAGNAYNMGMARTGGVNAANYPASSMVPRDVLAYGLMTPANRQNYMQNRANVGQWIGGSQQATQQYLNNGLAQYGSAIQKEPYGSAVGGNAMLTNQIKGQQGLAMSRSGATRPGAAGGMTGTTQYGTQQQSAYGQAPQPTNTGGYGMNLPFVGNVQTSIQPQGIYSDQMTQQATNQAVADADQKGDLNYLMRMFDQPGASRGDMQLGQAAPHVANAQLQAADARARIPWEDQMANQRNMFLGQVARENEGLGQGNLLARMYEMNNSDALSRLGSGLSYLQQLIG